MPTEQQKFRFLKKVYFGVSDNPQDDVNPFQSSSEFGESSVGDLRWGEDNNTREKSKLRFSFNYHKVLDSLNVHLAIEDIFSELQDEQTNDRVVENWTGKAMFR